MGDTIVVEGDDITYLIESDGNTDPVAERILYQALEEYSNFQQQQGLQGYNVDVLSPETSLLAAADGFVAGGGTGTRLEGVDEVIRALDSRADVFSEAGVPFAFLLDGVRDYEDNTRKAAAAAASAASSAAAARQREALARERDQVLRRLTRAEEDRRLEVQRQNQARDVQIANERSADQRASLEQRLNIIARNQFESDEQFDLALENLGLTRTEFERDSSLSSDVTRATAGALGATGSPVQDFQNRIRELGLAEDRERLDNQEEALTLEERIRQNQYLDQLEAAQREIEANTREENQRLLDFINNRNNAETDLANERRIEDTANNYQTALAGGEILNPEFVTAQENSVLLDFINNRNNGGSPEPTTPTSTPTFTDPVPTQPGTIDEVVDTVVTNVGSGSSGLFS